MCFSPPHPQAMKEESYNTDKLNQAFPPICLSGPKALVRDNNTSTSLVTAIMKRVHESHFLNAVLVGPLWHYSNNFLLGKLIEDPSWTGSPRVCYLRTAINKSIQLVWTGSCPFEQ